MTEAYERQLRQHGFNIVQTFAGPPASGKTTRAVALRDKLRDAGRLATIYDTDDGKTVVWAK